MESPSRKEELKTWPRNEMMSPSQCGVPWKTTKPPKKTLHTAGGKMLSTIQPETGHGSPGCRGRGLRTPVPAHGVTPSPMAMVTPHNDTSISLVPHEGQGGSLQVKGKQKDPPPLPQFPTLHPGKEGTCCCCFLFTLAAKLLSMFPARLCSRHCVCHANSHHCTNPASLGACIALYLLTEAAPEAQRG